MRCRSDALILAVTAISAASCGSDQHRADEGAMPASQETTIGSSGAGPRADSSAETRAGPGEPPEAEQVPNAAADVSGDTVALGVVRIWGANPLPVFVLAAPPPGGPAVALQGALRDELGALVGLEVRVRGRAVGHAPSPPARAVLVSSYEIVSVAGREPLVGILRGDGSEVTLGATRLVGAPDELRTAVGAKVWVLGTTRDGALAVESYGIIRRP